MEENKILLLFTKLRSVKTLDMFEIFSGPGSTATKRHEVDSREESKPSETGAIVPHRAMLSCFPSDRPREKRKENTNP